MIEFLNNIVNAVQKFNKKDDVIHDPKFLIDNINDFLSSVKRRDMLDGERYYAGAHDILWRKRMAIGEKGELKVVNNLPNAKIVDNQYKKMVNQKKNYLLGQPITFHSENIQYSDLLSSIFNKSFMATLKNVCEDSLNCGIGWIYVGYDEHGEFGFRRFRPYEIIPCWEDADHTRLQYAIRVYPIEEVTKFRRAPILKVEIYNDKGISFFTLRGNKLIADEPGAMPYFYAGNEGYNWDKIPLIPFKYNSKEIPLLKMVKSLQDGINLMESTFQNNMQEDARSTILVLINYEGVDLDEFRQNLATYGAVKVRSTSDGHGGGVQSLQVEVNAENYKAILELFKKALIENAMGFDAKDDRLSGNPNQMNIMSMYSDIDLDANDMETEYQAAMEKLLWFVNMHLANTGQGDYSSVPVEVIFNRDMLMNEGDIINNCRNSVGILSDETIVANHPWVDDVQAELERLKKQKEQEQSEYDLYQGAFRKQGDGDVEDED